MSVIIRDKKEELINKEPPITFPYTLDTFQTNAINAIEQGENVLVTAHTSAGKSTVAEYAIALAIHNGKKVVYTSPIKTLSNQKYYDFKNRYDSVGILTGDIKENPDADCIVMTTEILRNMLFRGNDFVNEIAYVIFDEIHYINDTSRGHVWEETITMLPSNIGLVMLSATISNSRNFAQWIAKIKNKNVSLVGTEYRPVPLSHYIYYDDDIHKIKDGGVSVINRETYIKIYKNYKKLVTRSKKPYNFVSKLPRLVKYLDKNNLFPCIFFSFSRINCERYASNISDGLLDHEQISRVRKIFNKYINGIFKSYKQLEQTDRLFRLLCKGVGFHHSGLVTPLKEIQEILFSEGLIKVLFATETFAVGVNMPTRTVVFTELDKHDGSSQRRLLSTSEYLQMAGRAGRRGKDKVGTVIYLPMKVPLDVQNITSIFTGKSTHVTSRLKLNTMFLMKIIKSQTFDCENFMNSSLLGIEDIDNKSVMQNDYDQKLVQLKGLESTLTEEDYVNEYFTLQSKLQYMKGNQAKKVNKKLTKILSIDPSRKSNIEQHRKYYELQKNIKDIEAVLHQNVMYLELDLARLFLQEMNFLTNKSTSLLELDRTHLTEKGLMGSEINECNELLLTEILHNNLLDTLSVEEICGVLAIFIQDRVDEPVRINDIKISKEISRVLEEIFIIDDDLYYMALDINKSNRNFVLSYDSGINLNFVMPAYLWARGENVKTIYQYTNVYEGNFVRNIIKVLNICNEIIHVSELVGNTKIMEKLQNMETLLLRDIVSFDSIYI